MIPGDTVLTMALSPFKFKLLVPTEIYSSATWWRYADKEVAVCGRKRAIFVS